MAVVIVGAGVGGIAAAVELRSHGFTDVTILERAPQLGGTWFYNSYPGAACDVPSHLYSYSFAQRRDWSRLCSLQEEIWHYLNGVARDHGVDQLVVPNTEVSSCTWDDVSKRWAVASSDGRSWDSDAVIIATGQLHQPAIPSLPGQAEFTGHSFHSSQWDHDYELRGKRIAVLGTGASAVQFVPEVAKQAQRLFVFQRTGNWFFPRKNRPYPAVVRAIVKRVPGVQAFRRRFIYNYGEFLTAMIRHPRTVGWLGRARSEAFMRWQLRRDPGLRRRVWPNYTFGCKRVLFSSDFLPALQRSNVELVTERIERMTHGGIVCADGSEYKIDCVIYGTGFRANDFMFPMEITGTDGQSLKQAWANGPHAHLGVSVPGFPSLFFMYGPNTNTSGGSIIVYEEAQAAYIRQALEHVRDRHAAAIEVRSDVEAASDQGLQSRFAGTAWTLCSSWYRDSEGRIVANWPGYMREYETQVHTLDPSEFRFLPLPDRASYPT
jgi:cation diffusion facilitator CzcD-associated flavoprotein CzcO